jgi:hypothetical protein
VIRRFAAGQRGLRVPLPRVSGLVLSLALAVACSGPSGSRATPPLSALGSTGTATPGSAASGSESQPASDLSRIGGRQLEVVSYSVPDSLAVEGGGPIGAMIEGLQVDPSHVELSLAVAPGGDPTISDWRLPGASASAILGAWMDAAPGAWRSDALAGLPAFTGDGPDGSAAWAFALEERFVYVRTDDRALAEQVAAALHP